MTSILLGFSYYLNINKQANKKKERKKEKMMQSHTVVYYVTANLHLLL
jgi:hypothetical protein